jgi:hypothetical protein
MRRILLLCAVSLQACSSSNGITDPDRGCEPSEIEASAFTACTCKRVPRDPGPGSFGCATPRTLYQRVCMIDSSCNVYSADRGADPLAISTSRADVAFQWEWAEALPEDANLVLNSPSPGDSALLSPLTLFAVRGREPKLNSVCRRKLLALSAGLRIQPENSLATR